MSEIDDAFDFLHTAVSAMQDGDMKTCTDMLESAFLAYMQAENAPQSDKVIFWRYVQAIENVLNENVEPVDDTSDRRVLN